jgi:hypothetical protein
MTYVNLARQLSVSALIFLILMIAAKVNASAAETLKPEELLQRHLDSIGKSEARAAVKSRVMQGTAAYKLLVGGSGQINGKSVMASEDNKLQLLLKVNANAYHGEKFVRSGDKTFVFGTYDDATRSEFGEFLRSQDSPLREGLLGGVLSTGWPLLDLNGHGAKLHIEGRKKIDGAELLAASYRPKKSSDLNITLYFDPNTFRHVMTLYTTSRSSGIGLGGEQESARRNEARYRIEERFGDFKEVDGVTLPFHYDLRYQQELQTGFTKLVEWDVTASSIQNNVSLDPRNFEIR